MKDTDQPILYKDGVSYVLPFILVTCCFALWGFANDITNPMVKAFSKIFRMSVTDGAFVQVAFYGGYFAMAFPAAMFIRKYSYKAGILLGLGLYAVGALLFFPAKMTGSYYPFLLAYFILTCGLSFLETSSNPYILSMGTEATATRRLNLAQSFNPMGSLLGMYVAMNFIQAKLNPMDTAERAQLNPAEFAMVRDADLSVLIAPYLTIGIVILVMLLVIRFTQMPKNGDQSHSINFGPTLKRIFSIHHYREGVHWGWILALILVVVSYIYFNKTKQGYEIAVVGESNNTARYAGINVGRVFRRTMFLSGALCGLVGMLQCKQRLICSPLRLADSREQTVKPPATIAASIIRITSGIFGKI